MATLTVRNLDDDVQQRLRRRAVEHGRSMEAEARHILTVAVGTPSMIVDWIAATSGLGVDLELRDRTPPRDLDLS